MTNNAVMTRVNAALDQIEANTLNNAANVIMQHGEPTREEFESFMQLQVEMFAASRAKFLAEVGAWLEEH